MKALYKFHFDCGRNGELNGLFIADDGDVNELMKNGTVVYFGEVLGKHSEIMGPIEKDDLTFVTHDEKVIAVIEHFKLEIGFNPFDYMEVDEDDIEDVEVKDDE